MAYALQTRRVILSVKITSLPTKLQEKSACKASSLLLFQYLRFGVTLSEGPKDWIICCPIIIMG